MLQLLNHPYARMTSILVLLGVYVVTSFRMDWYAALAERWIVAVHQAAPATAEVFPCAGHGCGCQDAQDCQTGCCCYPAGVTDTTATADAQHADDDMAVCTTAPEDQLPPPRIALLDHTLAVDAESDAMHATGGTVGMRPIHRLSDRHTEPEEPIPRRSARASNPRA